MSRRVNEDFHWLQEGKTLLADCHIFSVYKADRVSPHGARADRYYLDAPDWVTVVALVKQNDEDHCLMVRQYRQGSQSVTCEFPAGTVDPGENPEEAMARELLEETGYQAKKLILLGQVNPNPAFMNNQQYIYLAEYPELVGELALDEHEDIEVEILPLKEVTAKMGTGDFDNGTMMTALGFFIRYRSGF